MKHDKPYFLPLKKEYYLKIKNGEQDCEIRPLGHRGWNHKNVYPLREISPSNGYQKKGRLLRVIKKVNATSNLAWSGVPQWHIDAVEAIYGKRQFWLIAYFYQD